MPKPTAHEGERNVVGRTGSKLSTDLETALQREESITFKPVDATYLRKAAATEQSS